MNQSDASLGMSIVETLNQIFIIKLVKNINIAPKRIRTSH